MTFVHRESRSLLGNGPLKYETGSEIRMDCVVDYSTVSTNSNSQRVIDDGELLCRITASDKWGPYDPTASDGRQTVSAPSGGTVQTVVAGEYKNVTLGDDVMAGYVHNCYFDLSVIEDASEASGISTDDLEDAFPTCIFDD
jgi:hypothetical protein